MKSYKFRLKPSPRIVRIFEQWLDVCRELYNAGLQERRDAWKINQISINYHAQAVQLPPIKAIREDFAAVNAQVLQDTLRRLSKTFDAFFRRLKQGEQAGYPRFKSKYRFNSFSFPQARGTFSNKLANSVTGVDARILTAKATPSASHQGQPERSHLLAVANQQDIAHQHRVV